MAEHLASIFGTEKDRVNCPFYFKVREALARARAPLRRAPIYFSTFVRSDL